MALAIDQPYGADGIVARSLKRTDEKPLNAQIYCNLRILALSLRNPCESLDTQCGNSKLCLLDPKKAGDDIERTTDAQKFCLRPGFEICA